MREIIDMLTGGHGAAAPPAASSATANLPDLSFQRDVLHSLGHEPKELPAKYFYDRRGADLLDAIGTTPEHYQTRIETSLLKACARTIAELIGEGATVVDLGACDARKARILLGALKHPQAYIPVGNSARRLWSSAMQLQLDFPCLAVHPVNGDFASLRQLPDEGVPAREQVAFLAFGSVFGAFDPITAAGLLRKISSMSMRNLLIIGVDLRKDVGVLERSYNDSTGFTAELNLNLLLRINQELGADFDLASFEHVAFYNETCGRMEMHLRSRKRQTVHVGGDTVTFEKGEHIHTDNAYIYTIGQFHRLAQRANYIPIKAWTDPERLFSLHVLCKAGDLFR